MNVSIICPIYKGEKYIEPLYNNILKQKNTSIVEIKFILTESNDRSEEVLNKLRVDYEKILPSEFSHSLVREKSGFKAKGDIIVFITQDIQIKSEDWLYELIKDIDLGKCHAAFSRQIAYDNHTIEKYTREINYPDISRIVSKEDINKLGLMTFFFSDASSAISKKVFVELKGYDNKNLPTNEDMYLAYKLITNGYKIKYASKSEVIHSHELTLKETFKRYRDIGRFFSENKYFDEYNANERGIDVLKYILRRVYEERKIYLLPNIFLNFIARFIGMKFGKLK